MKRFLFYCAVLAGLFGSAAGVAGTPITNLGNNMKTLAKLRFTIQKSFFTENLSGDWKKTLPADAKKIDFAFGKVIDLDGIAGRTGKCMDECIVSISFQSSAKGVFDFGIGADWWVEVYANGKLCCSTMKNGNGSPRLSVADNPFLLPVKAGENLLAIKIRRGSCGWKMVCGPAPYSLYRGKIPWEKGTAPRPVPRSGQSYRLIVLGDLHYDIDEKIYHSHYVDDPRWGKIQRAEFARNAEMWKTRNPRMMSAAAAQITPDTLAVIQVGDLIQGDCGDPEVHSRMLLDTLGFLKKKFHGLPLLTVTGNHDVRGTGAMKAYNQTMPEYHSRELKKTVTKTTFYTFLGGDLFLFIDFNDPDLAVIIEAMKQKARYKFVVSHGPVLPATAGGDFYRWFLYGRLDVWRYLTHQLFMREDVVVLTGHVHDIELTECVTTEGRITQLMANSVWSSAELAKLKTLYSKPSEYGIELKSADAKKLFGEYRNVITRYWKARGAGFFVLDVTPAGITAKYFGGAARTPSKEIRLKR